MSNGDTPSPLGRIPSEVSEAIIKPVSDEVGKAIEEGVQSVTGSQTPQITPEQQAKKKEEEAKKKQWALRVIDWYKNLAADQAKVRQDQQAKLQAQNQQIQEKEKVKQFDEFKKEQKESEAVTVAQRVREIKKGVGG